MMLSDKERQWAELEKEAGTEAVSVPLKAETTFPTV